MTDEQMILEDVRVRNIPRFTLYRDYKGNLYYVTGLARLLENGEPTEKEMVFYQQLYGEYEYCVMPYFDFIAEVEKGIENPTGQRYRFELIKDNLVGC